MRPANLLVAAATVSAIATGAFSARAELLVGLAAPLTGDLSWQGEQAEQAMRLAVADLNGAGGVLDETVGLVTVDDYCDPEQAIAAAHKLVQSGVSVVIGHPCSSAAIPSSAVYREAGVLMITPAASHPELTEQGFGNVFRTVGRDDRQAAMAADYLADRWTGKEMAILHDARAFGQGIAEQTGDQLAARGIEPAFHEAIAPGERDYFGVIDEMRSQGIAVVYFGGYAAEAGLILRQAHDRGYELRMISGDNLNSEFFWLVAGAAGEGTLFTTFPDVRESPAAADVVARFRAEYQEPQSVALYTYAAAQAWAEAAEKAGTFESAAVAQALRSHEFDTVLGQIGFDAKGDVTGYETYAWYVWKDGKYTPFEPGELSK
jgi:branched-chain amino acid transport system substrate-binding protein